MALALQASTLVRYAPSTVADAFIQSRLGSRSLMYGALLAGVDAIAADARMLLLSPLRSSRISDFSRGARAFPERH